MNHLNIRQFKSSISKRIRKLSPAPDESIIIIDMGLVDAIMLHFKCKKHEALSKISEIIKTSPPKKGLKIFKKFKNKPIIMVIARSFYGHEITVTLESPTMVLTLNQLHQYVIDKSLESLIFSNKRGKK